MARQEAQVSGSHLLGIDHEDFVLTAIRGHEGISRLSRFQLEMLSDKNAIPASEMVGIWRSFKLRLPDDSWRHFNGIVSSFERGDEDENGRRRYFAEVVSWPWILTRRATCRVFQSMTVKEILEKVFSYAGYGGDFWDMDGIKGEHRKREYCVQYRETDFNFVSRLMEEEGIFYFFRYTEGHHVMVLADRKGAYKECVEEAVDYPSNVGASGIADQLTSWQRRHRAVTGAWAQRDYDFKNPTQDLRTSEQTIIEHMQTMMLAHQFYDYPGLYQSTSDGKPLTKVRMEETEVEHETVESTSTCARFTPGGVFKVGSHRAGEEAGKSYVITSVDHLVSETTPFETGVAGTRGYSNRFTCIPDSVVFRPGRQTLKPSIQGLHTAKVMGPEGQEIYTDKYGRVKVQFHWDPLGRDYIEGPFKPEETSCWIRVAQISAGQQWGAHFWPRVGHEVVVAFLEGDPDQPLIIGSVYNGKNMPPYALPENQTRSGIKTRSTPGGGPDNFNEIRFEDRKGKEEIYIHAERTMRTVVEASESRSVGGSRTTTVGGDDKLTVQKGDRDTTIKEGNDILLVEKGNIDQSCPNGTFRIMGKEVEVEGTDRIKLICGGSSITLEPGSIKIHSPMIESAASGVHDIKGAPVKINC